MSPTTQVQPPPQDPSGANGGPGDAVEEFLRTVRAPARPDGPDPRVPIAFAAGWHVADAITASGETGSQDDERKAAGALAASMLHADLARLREPLVHAEQNIAELAEAIDGLEDPSEHPEAAREVDRRFGAALMAADFRLGKAFMLGCKIAGLRDAAAEPFDGKAFAGRFLSEHDQLQDWLSQLATALPPNAGHSVRDSLNMWAAGLSGSGDAGRHLEAMHVHTQIATWRTLLSGEKAGRDMLEIPDYLGVAEAVADDIGDVFRQGLRRFRPWVIGAAALLVTGIALIIAFRDSAGIAAGITTVLGTLGLGWKGLGGSIGRAVAKVEQPAWAAQVDRAIAFAITKPLPEPLVDGAAEQSLLGALGTWRREHERPVDQGVRFSRIAH